MKLARGRYAALYGPTVGDRLRLGDTNLIAEVEQDHTVYGEEVVFGGGKVIRDGQGQSQRTRADGTPDVVITNAVIIDYWGIVKADVGIRDGKIVAIGKAGNPDIQDGVSEGLAIGLAGDGAGAEMALESGDCGPGVVVEAAMVRIEDGTYGTCVGCGAAIDPRRLLAYPTASRCHACQSRIESPAA